MTPSLDPAFLINLCTELSAVVEAELRRGNFVLETSPTWGLGGGTVWMGRQFAQHILGEGVIYRRMEDHHDGFAEIVCAAHKQIIICGLGK